MTEARNPLGVVVVIADLDPHQCDDWKSALDYVARIANATDPMLVSMFTIYWGEND